MVCFGKIFNVRNGEKLRFFKYTLTENFFVSYTGKMGEAIVDFLLTLLMSSFKTEYQKGNNDVFRCVS